MQWKPVSDYHRSQLMNPKVLQYFERKVSAYTVF